MWKPFARNGIIAISVRAKTGENVCVRVIHRPIVPSQTKYMVPLVWLLRIGHTMKSTGKWQQQQTAKKCGKEQVVGRFQQLANAMCEK